MTKSNITKLMDAVDATQATAVSAEINPQRIVDERGAFQVEVSADPRAGSSLNTTATVTLEGRLTVASGASYDVLHTVNLTDLELAAAYPASKIIADAQIVPHMVARLNNSGTDVDSGVTVSVWLME